MQKSFLILFILIFSLSNFTQALMIKLSLRKLTIEADAIILGEVKNIQCQWSIDKSIILTIVTLQIHEILKGNINSHQVLIQYPGGEVGDIGLKVSDMPSFRPNEMVLVFLKSITDITNIRHSPIITLNFLPVFSIFGAAQGKYSIDSNGIAHKSGYRLISKDYEPDMSLPLAELKSNIERILHQNQKEREKTREKIKH